MTNDDIKAIHKCTALSDDFLAEIGRITAHFALLEKDFISLAHTLLNVPENIAITITSELSFRALQNLVASLVKELISEKSDELAAILKNVVKAEERRNQVSHSLWGAALRKTPGEYRVVRTKYSAKQKKGLHFAREELTVPDLYAIARDISIAAYDVEKFNFSIIRTLSEHRLQSRAHIN